MVELPMENHPSLRERLENMSSRTPRKTSQYYAVTLLGEADGNTYHSVYSHWVGYKDDDLRIELRKASLIWADRVVGAYRNNGERCLVVDDSTEFNIFVLVGGHAVVERFLAENAIPTWLASIPVAHDSFGGFVAADMLPNTAMNRAPTPKVRMKILQRDDFRCRICGRKASDHVDVELHVHHIRPWAQGGLTLENNLITLCHTCHKGLDPHFNPNLYGLVAGEGLFETAEGHAKKYWECVRYYVQAHREI